MAEVDDNTTKAFAMLQPICSRLFELPVAITDDSYIVFKSLIQALRDCPSTGLRTCLEYVLFPLQLLLDAAVNSRSQRSLKVGMGHNIKDKIAEGGLLSLEELLQHCPLSSVSQMSLLLRKLTAALLLSPEEASEEFRHGALKCLKQLIVGSSICNLSCCSCKVPLPHLIVYHEGCLQADLLSTGCPPGSMPDVFTRETLGSEGDCIIAFLRSEDMSIAVGHLFTLLLQISETEAFRGGHGSTRLRIDALLTLRVLIHKVGTADALAFFLPGVSSRLFNALKSWKKADAKDHELSQPSYPRGAAGSSGAVEQALRALTELVVLVLADERNLEALDARHKGRLLAKAIEENLETGNSAESTLAVLFEMSKRQKDKNADSIMDGQHMQTDSYLADRKLTESKFDTSQKLEILRVVRDNNWLECTLERVNTLLSLSFPSLCQHSMPAIRLAVTEAATMIILACGCTLEKSKLSLLECLLAMACDEWLSIASAAHASLMLIVSQSLGTVSTQKDLRSDFKQVMSRSLEKLPKAVFSGDEKSIVFLCRQLLAAMFYCGPRGVNECLFDSPVATRHFVAVMSQCMGFKAMSVGSFKQLTVRTGGPGYISDISTLTAKASNLMEMDNSSVPRHPDTAEEKVGTKLLPRIPPWQRDSGERKTYCELAAVLRLLGLSAVSGNRDARYLFGLVEELLIPLRHITSGHHAGSLNYEMGKVEQNSSFLADGQWQRTAATAVSVLNEVLYGASGNWKLGNLLFRVQAEHQMPKTQISSLDQWLDLSQSESSRCLSDFVGDILHDYTSDAIWNLPLEGSKDGLHCVSVHVLRDNAALQQVTLEGIGVLASCVSNLFEEGGFLGSILYILLEQLGGTNYEVSESANLSLQVVAAACGFQMVKALVQASIDYIVDSLCRQLHHLDLYPNAPNMLVAMLRYTGTAHDLLPLLQEPMRIISSELEIPARIQHPTNTRPMLRALREIVHAAKSEGLAMLESSSSPNLASQSVSSQLQELYSSGDMHEQVVSSYREGQRCCQTIQDITITCLSVSAPLMASKDQLACLVCLEIVEAGIFALSCMDVAARRQKGHFETVLRHLIPSDIDPSQIDSDMEASKLLPTMHRVWPHLAACMKNTIPSVLIQALRVIASVVSSCGGEFFTRRFQTDVVPKMLNLLCQSTLLKLQGGGEHAPKLLFHLQGGDSAGIAKEFAADSVFKVQESILTCIAEIAKNERSAPALLGSMCGLAAIVVGLACGTSSLQDKAIQALIALANIDADLIWILVADIAYGGMAMLPQSIGDQFPEISELLPPLPSPEEALWFQMAGREFSLNVDSSMALNVLSII